MISQNKPIIAIIGPTASGKTGLSLELARELGGEIICADSRTIYRGMDIGTAKPTRAEQAIAPHHLLDVIEPGQSYSAAQFKTNAETAIQDIMQRKRLPLVVGGTGLYVYSLLYDYQFPAGPRTAERATLEALPLSELVERLETEDPEVARQIDLRNPRRVIRALETVGQPHQKSQQLNSNILLIGLRPHPDKLNNNIDQRTQTMVQIGLVDEVAKLIHRYGAEQEAFRSPGYAEIIEFLANKVTLAEAEELIKLHTRQLVRRQLTWFKRNPEIHWVASPGEAKTLVSQFLERV